MAIVSLEQAKLHLRVDFDDDDALIENQLIAAQNHIERLLGFRIEKTFGNEGEGQDPIPASLQQAVLMLTGHWYANRDAVLIDASPRYVPLGVREIVNEYRNWSF
ncbi:head-tail connector protein [Martelella mangrovi]|uniref:Phage protein (Predicted DNA packaging) n=1 Tax=Martelella mangrovi TaxID=1397477 RepID=A0ABV2IES2_9HYPH